MRLGLLGFPIAHSRSPEIYRELLGEELESYELLEIKNSSDVPTLTELARKVDGLSITAPYKKHFLSEKIEMSELVKKVGAINTLSFKPGLIKATNTDLEATKIILKRYQSQFPKMNLILLGDGSMAGLTRVLAEALKIPVLQKSRSEGLNLSEFNLRDLYDSEYQTIVINSCARSFIFSGELHPSFIFWDYNYDFPPHRDSIPRKVFSYEDGREMLRLQAIEAIRFWSV